ncbi:HPr family phosphocarrier protein [Microbacterium sp. C5A9]|uniref:HPr family phosphocarrier protein n=1 Tax=Microbacterium sp. C5A9 TaxID=2736663 RepID=UPI001F51701F|nr:HPr family phosphocarrier protein [Microbacterium sp. C5A9]MCI1019416.1 HPr family phosphocarrier protein [Microbacterium sp. C5A9]
MPRRQVVITAHNGVHARPVAEIVRVVQAHPHAVTLRTSTGAVVDLSSVLALMDLGLTSGDVVVLETADSAGADRMLDTLSGVLDPRR